jgi:hypothetical protein
MTTSSSNGAYDTLISLRDKLTRLNGMITPEAVDKLKDELGGIFTVAKTHHYEQGQKYGHLASAIPESKYRTIIGDATWTYAAPANPEAYSQAALLVGSAAAQRELAGAATVYHTVLTCPVPFVQQDGAEGSPDPPEQLFVPVVGTPKIIANASQGSSFVGTPDAPPGSTAQNLNVPLTSLPLSQKRVNSVSPGVKHIRFAVGIEPFEPPPPSTQLINVNDPQDPL